MSVTELLTELAEIGVKISVREGQLKVKAPKGSLTKTLKQRIGENKDALIAMLDADKAQTQRAALPQIVPEPSTWHEPFPLTDIQQAYWIGRHGDVDLGGVGIHIYSEVDCEDLNLDNFIGAWRRVIARHDMLRAVVQQDGSQRILADVPDYEPAVLDLTQASMDSESAQLQGLRDQMSHSTRSPDVWPCFDVRASLMRNGMTRLHFSIDLVHIDGGSLQMLFGDLADYYRSLDADLPQLQLSYRDYVLAEKELQKTQMYRESLEFWQGAVQDMPAAPDIPMTKNISEIGTPRFKHGSTLLDRDTWSAIKSKLVKFGFSPPAVLLAVYAEALASWSREAELTVNVTVFNRLPMHEQIGQILGDFTSMVLFGVKHQPSDDFYTRVKRVQENLWSAFEHRHVSGVQVLRELAKARGSRQAALMPVVFTSFLNLEDDGSAMPNSDLRTFGEIVFSTTQTPQVWLDHQVLEDDGALLLSWDAMQDVFPDGLIDDMFAGYLRFLGQLTDDEAWRRPPRGLISAGELDRRKSINATDRPFPNNTLYELFAERVALDGDREALITANTRLSYRDLFRRANRLGHWLCNHGLEPDKLVAVVMEKGWDQMVGVMGVMASGAAYLPIDPEMPPERLKHLLRDGEVRVVLTQEKLEHRLDWPPGLVILSLDVERETEALPDTQPQVACGPGNLAYVLYTSGSTGVPKGVMIEHRNVVNRMFDICSRFKIGPGDRVLGVTALHHDLSVFDVFGVLTSGAALVMPRSNRRLDPAHWAEICKSERITLWNSVPTFLNMFVEHLESAGDEKPLEALRWAILAGDWIPLDLPQRLRAQAGDLTFVASGGPTETTIWDIYNIVESVEPHWTSIPYGKPLANARYHILDEALEPCPMWVPGEMCIAGAGLARGYWKNEAASQAFFNHPRTGERMYRSGDMGRFLPDGNIEIMGRKDFQVKIRGMRIELGEIEAMLRKHPHVRAAVVSLIGERFGPQKLAAHLVPDNPDEAPSEESLRAFLNERLPPYMVPGHYIQLENLPLNPSGKVDRKALPAPDQALKNEKRVFVAPRDETEEAVAKLWREALSVDKLSVEDNLIDLGVNSLMAIQVNGRIRDEFGVELPLRLLLEAPTVAGLVRALHEIEHEGGDHAAELPQVTPNPAERSQPFPLNPIQQAYWMGRMETFELGNVAAQYYLEFETPDLDMDQINRAWNAIIQRHDMLRSIVRNDGQQQILADVNPYVIELLDMRGWDPKKAETERLKIRDRMAHQVLPADVWPLFEFRATQMEDHTVRFHFSLDLLIADAWSAQIIFDDFRRLVEHPKATLPELTLSFRDYLLVDMSLEDTEMVRVSKEYWWNRLDQMPPAPALPLIKNPASLEKPVFVRRNFKLESDIWANLKHRATEAGVTPSGMLMTAFGEILSRWSRNPALTINVTTFRRLPLHSEVNAIVGDFTSLTLLEIDCSQLASFKERAQQIQNCLWQDLDHRYVSGVEILRELAKRQGRAPGALMPVVFTSLLTRYEGEDGGYVADEAGMDEIFALSQTPQVWLDHQVIEEGGRLVVNWDAVDELFPDGLLDDMMAAYQGLLTDLAAGKSHWEIPALEQLPEAQVARRIEANQTETSLQTSTLHQLFHTRVHAGGERIAVIDGDHELSYAELAAEANRVGRALQAKGVSAGNMIAVICNKSWQQLAAAIGVLEAGGAYLPIDPAWPADRRAFVMAQGQVCAIVTQVDLDNTLEWPQELPRICVDSKQTAGFDGSSLPVAAKPDDLAYVIFTSGSTGRPKGVSIEHRGAVNTILDINRRFNVGVDDKVLALSSLSFDLSVYDLFGVLAAGGTIVVPEPEAGRDPKRWVELMVRHGVTLWNSVPALMELLVEHMETRPDRPVSLRLALLSGDWLPVTIADRLRAMIPAARVISLGGATEASIWSIAYEIEQTDPDWRSVPYGKPLSNQRFYVLDSAKRTCADWVPGELYIAGIGLARDYFGDEEKTKRSYSTYSGTPVPGGPAAGERLYCTGDWGRYLPDGNIEFLGREDNQVKIQGFRIELGEIETVIGAHEEVTTAVALAVGDKRNNRRLVLFYVPRDGATPDVDDLKSFASERLTEYMVPSAFFAIDALPLTANGKVDRNALAEADYLEADGETKLIGARTPVEEELVTLWRELLEVDQIGVHETLFDLGGNSLVAIRMLSHLQELFGVEVSMRDLFDNPSVAGLAGVIVRLKAGAGETGQSMGEGLGLTLKPDPANRFEPFPLSDIQQAYLLGRISNLELGNVAAHAYIEIEVPGDAPDRIQAAWQRLVDRHDMLRTVFYSDGTQQVLKDLPPYEMKVYDHTNGDESATQTHIQALRDELSHQVLPTDQWPLFDMRITRLPAEKMRMHISFDLLTADAWSSQILFWELAKVAVDPNAQLPPLEITFRDYMLAVDYLPNTDQYRKARSYWQRRLPDLPAAPDLPLALDPATIDQPHFERRSGRIEADEWTEIQRFAASAGLTASGLCLAAYAEVLAAWSSSPQFSINVTTFNRLPIHNQIPDLVGDFTSLTLLAVDTQMEGAFEMRARRLQERLWEDLDNRYYSGVQVVRDLATQMGRAPGALMPVVFTSRLFSSGGAEESESNADWPGGDVVYSVSQTPQVWLDMQVSETNGALTWTWDAVESLFHDGVLDAMFSAYINLLKTLGQSEAAWRSDTLELAPQSDRDLFAQANQTRSQIDKRTLYSLFDEQARSHPNHPAVITAEETLSYADLEKLAIGISSQISDQITQPDTRVAIVMPKGWQQIAAALGIVRAGGAYVPIDPAWPNPRVTMLLEDARINIVLTVPDTDNAFDWPNGMQRVTVTRESVLAVTPKPAGSPTPKDLAYVIFTSGTTGRPKGVAIEHAAAANTLQDMRTRFKLSPEDRVFGLSNLTFDLSVFDVFGTFHAGATLVLPDDNSRRDPSRWAEMLNTHGVSVWNSVPALMEMLIEHCANHADAVPAKLRLALLSGDWLALDIAQRLQALVPSAKVVSLGGATEASIWSICHPVCKRLPGWSSVPYGKAMANQRFYVLDNQLRECPVWVTGDLYIAGDGLAREYLGDETKTAASFKIHPVTGERIYRTGDTGRWRPEGLIEFQGRKDTQVKVQGYRIELGEIESVLIEHARVGGVVAEAPGDPRGNRRLVAYLVLSQTDVESGPGLHEELRSYAEKHLPAYMIPSAFVFLDSFPLTANGKVNRAALPAVDQLDSAEDTEQARTLIEQELSELWCELLGLEQVGIRDGLFELGGNSLIAIRMVAAIKEKLRVELELRTLFAKPTIAELADVLAKRKAESDGEVGADEDLHIEADPDNRFEPFPLNDVQQAYWMGRQNAMELGSVAAHSYTEMDSSTLDPKRIEAIWRNLIHRHDMLRAIVNPGGDQRVLDPESLPLFEIPIYDLSELDSSERDQRLQKLRDEMSHQVLDTATWPLFDIRISRMDAQTIRIHYSFDLLIADAWSSQLLTLEFAYQYAEPDVRFEALEVGFRDYVLAMERRDNSSRYRADRNYWRRRLEEMPPAPELPIAVDPATIDSPTFVRRHGTLEPQHWTVLRERAAEMGITGSGLLMAVFAEVLGAWSRNPRFTLNVTTFNRMPVHHQINSVVGDFTSLTLLSVDTTPEQELSFALRARRVQEQLWSDLDHRTYSGVEVIRDLARSWGQKPGALMPVVFTSRLFKDPRVAKMAESDASYGEVVYSVSQTPQVWLDAQVLEHGDTLIWSWDVVDQLFPDGMVDALFEAQTNLLLHLAENEAAWNDSAFDLLPDHHRAVYAEANDTAHDFGPAADITMDRLLLDRVTSHADQPVIIAADRTITYAQLYRGAARLAHQLREAGAVPNGLISVSMPKGWQQSVATMAVIMAGGAYLPTDPAWPLQRRDRVLELGRVALIVTLPDHQDRQWPANTTVFSFDENILAEGEVTPPQQTAQPDDLAYVIFTSGSTGEPKGVAIEHKAAVNTILDINQRFDIGSEDRTFALSALTFDLSVYDLFGMYACGGAAVLPPPGADRDPSIWSQVATRNRVTLWNSVPALLDMMLIYADANPGSVPPALRVAMLSGDWLPVDIGDRLHAQVPNAVTYSLGGATEASIWSIYYPVETPAPDWPSVPYGKPMANQTFHVFDSALNMRPFWVPGELHIGGVGLAREYWGDADKTASSFITHPETGVRYYRTGDMGKYLPDGNIEFLGREDTQVKVQGFRIELGEIEAALARSESIESAVVSAPLIADGGRARRLVAYIVFKAGSNPLDPEALKNFLADHVPEYMIPATFIELDSLPLTANGKVDRRSLPDPSDWVDDSTAPRTPTEKRLCVIWAELLGVPKLGIDDNLFDMGGTSVTAIQLLNEVREHFGIEINLRTLFENLTVRTLALAMSQARASGEAVLVNDLPTLRPDLEHRYDRFPLNDIQQAYWVGRMGAFGMGEISAHYYAEVESVDLSLDGFATALRAMIDRHDALRLVFDDDGFQRILKDVEPYQVKFLDLVGMDPDEAHEKLMEIRGYMSHQMFKTDVWPLFEIRATQVSERRTRLHLSFDLLLADAWSFQLLFRDMSAIAQDPNARLEPLEISFRDYLMTERQIQETELFRRSYDYWMGRIDEVPPAPDLPLRVGDTSEAKFERYEATIPAEDWTKLQEMAAGLGATPTGVLMSAFSEILANWSRSPRFTLNVTMFNRLPLHPQVNLLLGDFTSMTLVGVDTDPGETEDNFALHVRRMQERLWTDLDHGHYGGVKYLRDLARHWGRPAGATMPIVFTSRLFKISGFDSKTVAGQDMGEMVYSISQTPQVWIDHQLSEREGALVFNWDVVTSIFPEGMVDIMFAAYEQLLLDLARNPEMWHQPIPQLTPSATVQKHAALNPAPISTTFQPVHAAVLEQARTRPDASAVIAGNLDGAVRLSYRETMERVAAVCKWLDKPAVGTPVAVMLDRGWEQVVASLAILAGGGAVMPINAGMPAARVAKILEHAGVDVVLSHSKLLESLKLPEQVKCLGVDTVVGSAEPIGALDIHPDQLALLLYSTSANGEPVGVEIQHRALAHSLADVVKRFEIAETDHALVLGDLDLEHTLTEYLAPLGMGGLVVIPRSVKDPAYLWQLMQTHEVTIWGGEPDLVAAVLDHIPNQPQFQPRLSLLTGDVAPVDLYQGIKTKLPQSRVVYLFGAAETAGWSLCFEGDQISDQAGGVPYGLPMTNRGMYVLDRSLRPRPTWVPGDLYITGDGLAKGYRNDEARTSTSFLEIPDPFNPDLTIRVFRTGQVCRHLPDGVIEFVDLDDTPVAVRRTQNDFGETRAILGAHPAISEAHVVALPPLEGEARGLNRRVIAYVAGAAKKTPALAAPPIPSAQEQTGAPPAMPDPEALYRTLTFQPVYTPLERLQFKMERRGIRKDMEGRTQVEFDQDITEQDLQDYTNRSSRRRFLDEPVGLDDFGRMLESLRAIQPKGLPLPKYRYPSGGGLYPVQTYISVTPNRVQGLDGGIYYYHPLRHVLEQLSDEAVPAHFHAPDNLPIVEHAAFTIFFMGRLHAVSPLYPEMGRDFCALEAGYMGQQLMEDLPDTLGVCPLGGLAFGPVRDRFQLEDTDEMVHLMVGGAVKPAQKSLKDTFLGEQLDARDFAAMNKAKAVVTDKPSGEFNDDKHWGVHRIEQPNWIEDAVFDPLGRLQFKLAKKALRPEAATEIILPAVALDQDTEQRYAQRRSYQGFLQQTISQAALGSWLSCLRSIQPDAMPLPKYRYPSGGGLYPVGAYLHLKTDAVEGLAAGVWYYDPVGHRLIQIKAGVHINTELHGMPNRGIYDSASISIFLMAKYGAVGPLYPGLARDFCLVEAGYMGQLLTTNSVEHGIGVTPLGGLDFSQVRDQFDLAEDEDVVHVFVAGPVAPPVSLQDAFNQAAPQEVRIEPAVLREYLAEQLPEHMLPSRFVVLDALPRTPEGKVDVAMLPDPDAEAKPDTYEEPASENEFRIAEIWREVLSIDHPDVARNFFELGGTSVQMVQMHGRLQETFEKNFPLAELFEHPSIRDQARYFEKSGGGPDLEESRKQAAKRKSARKRRRKK